MDSQPGFLHRSQAVLLTLGAVAVVCSIWAVSKQQAKTPVTLQRSNALRRRNRGHSNLTLESPPPAEQDAQTDDPAVHEVKALLYHIAEDQSMRKAFAHRGIRCEDCGETPIRSIRWHCLNCPDYDLCSACKALTAHPKNHVFAEIQIPIPVLAQPVEKLPLWYSGQPDLVQAGLSATKRRHLAQKHSFDEDEIDALVVQFSCLVDSRIEQDPCELYAAIGIRSFATSLSSPSWQPRARATVILERIFSFYDVNSVGTIDFESFLSGIAYLRSEKRFIPIERAIRGFDIDDDGYVSRRDMMSVLRAKFEMHYHIMHDMAEGELTEQLTGLRRVVTSSQPVSSAFRGEFEEQGDSRLDRKTNDADGFPIMDAAELHQTVASPLQGDDWPLNDIDPSRLTERQRSILGFEHAVDKSSASRETSLLDHVVSKALSHLLDRMFQEKEQTHVELVKTAQQRATWHKEIAARRKAQQERVLSLMHASDTDPRLATAACNSKIDEIHGVMIHKAFPTDAASLARMEGDLRSQSLAQLLGSSGYATEQDSTTGAPAQTDGSILEPAPSAGAPAVLSLHAPSMVQGNTNSMDVTLASEASIIAKTKQDSDLTDSEAQSTELSRLLTTSKSVLEQLVDADFDASTQGKPTPMVVTTHGQTVPGVNTEPTAEDHAPQPPNDVELERLSLLDQASHTIHFRAGQVCIRVEELATIVETDQTGELAGLMRSWLEWASF